jgi:hypothetical protein
MATILIKFTDERQYEASTSTIVYTDPTPKRWTDAFGKLQIGDNCIFHSSTDKLYVGEFSSSVAYVSVTFNNIRIASIKLDDFLRINEIIPETLSEFKRPKGPILRTQTFNINSIYIEARNKNFISFYVVKQGFEAQLLQTLNDNDRVITIDSNNRFVELYSLANGALNVLNLGIGYFNAKGKSLEELSVLAVTAEKPNHVRNIRRITNAIGTSSSYKFPSFTDYYNIFHNKSLFANNPPINVGNNNNGNNNIAPLPNNNNNMALNTILFGPPGTGKTFVTIDKAVDLIIGENDLDRFEKKVEFNRLQKEGRIYFTTFHQNMAYEDFIEGIKPIEPEEEDEFLKYEIQDGLFMKACIEATHDFIKSNVLDNEQEIQIKTFNQLYDQLYNQINQSDETKLDTLNGGHVLVSATKKGNFSIRHIDGTRTYTVSRSRLEPLFNTFEDLKVVNNIVDEFRAIIGGCNATAFWSILNAIHQIQPNADEIDEEIELTFEVKKEYVQKHWREAPFIEIENDISKPYVFIIDEINRGNIAQIFGELITLIEDDKRLSKTEEIRLQLPYSKQAFSVPPNLHIIATMNTADRSVEALDTALRRRFVFEPKMPKEDELTAEFDGISLQVLLSTINKRLRILKDNDHTIGHAWLMGINDLDQLKAVFKKKIIPLLQEYFYNDYEKLGLVLGDNFFLDTQRVNGAEFANFARGNGLSSQYKSKVLYELKDMSTLISADFLALIGVQEEDEE